VFTKLQIGQSLPSCCNFPLVEHIVPVCWFAECSMDRPLLQTLADQTSPSVAKVVLRVRMFGDHVISVTEGTSSGELNERCWMLKRQADASYSYGGVTMFATLSLKSGINRPLSVPNDADDRFRTSLYRCAAVLSWQHKLPGVSWLVYRFWRSPFKRQCGRKHHIAHYIFFIVVFSLHLPPSAVDVKLKCKQRKQNTLAVNQCHVTRRIFSRCRCLIDGPTLMKLHATNSNIGGHCLNCSKGLIASRWIPTSAVTGSDVTCAFIRVGLCVADSKRLPWLRAYKFIGKWSSCDVRSHVIIVISINPFRWPMW